MVMRISQGGPEGWQTDPPSPRRPFISPAGRAGDWRTLHHNEALAALGAPSTTSTVGGDAWYYIGQQMQHTLSFMPVKMTDQHVLAVYFDKSGKVDRIANYGMKDGKVFDFVRRTTPTGGSEPDFLKNIMGGLFKFS
jgi:outer membrane protein assembly factor BamE (lipoprotein component of BamABCDE complex)